MESEGVFYLFRLHRLLKRSCVRSLKEVIK